MFDILSWAAAIKPNRKAHTCLTHTLESYELYLTLWFCQLNKTDIKWKLPFVTQCLVYYIEYVLYLSTFSHAYTYVKCVVWVRIWLLEDSYAKLLSSQIKLNQNKIMRNMYKFG